MGKLAQALQQQYSKAGMQHIARQVSSGAWPFSELWGILLNGEAPLPKRAAWAIDHTLELQPKLFHTIIGEAAEALLQPQDDAIYRALLKGFNRLPSIPEEYQGLLFDRAIQWILDPKVAVAVRVFSITLAAKIAEGTPELEAEVCLTIESQFDLASAGFRSRGRKVLKRFR